MKHNLIILQKAHRLHLSFIFRVFQLETTACLWDKQAKTLPLSYQTDLPYQISTTIPVIA